MQSRRFAVTWHVAKRLLPFLLAVAVYMVAATTLVRWDLARHGVTLGDFQATAYAIFTQMIFEPTDPFPGSPIARSLFWLSPLVGALLLAQGLFKVGLSLFDSTTRREVWVDIVASQLHGHVIVCGVGHVGSRIVEELSLLGEQVIAVESDEKSTFVEGIRALGIPVKIGDARSDSLLLALGVQRAKAIVCATSDDLANLEIALDSKRFHPAIRVVMRMFDQRIAAKVGGALQLDQSFSTSALSAPLVAMQATHEGVRAAYRLDDRLRVTADVFIGQNTSVRAVEAKGVRVLSVQNRGAKSFTLVSSDAELSPGDLALVDIDAADLQQLRRTYAAT